MKTTILFIFALLVLLSCSKDNPEDIIPCFSYSAITTDNCDCIDNFDSCPKKYYTISKAEYEKLYYEELYYPMMQQTTPCVYWEEKDSYLIKLEKFVCPKLPYQ